MENKRLKLDDTAAYKKNILVIGKRATGKTTLVYELLREIGAPYEIVTYSDDNHTFDYYKTDKNCGTIHYVKDSSKLIDNIKSGSITVFENSIIGFRKDEMKDIMIKINDTGGGMIVIARYMMSMPQEILSNFNYIFCFRENMVANQTQLYNRIGNKCFSNFSDFQKVFEVMTKDYGCMVFHNTESGTEYFHHRVKF